METRSGARTIERREFVRRLSQAIAAASAATLASCASTRGKYASPSERPHRDVPFILARIDEINERISSDLFFDAPSSHLKGRGLDERLFRDSIKAMLLVGTFGDLCEQDRAHPAMQQRMFENIGLFDRTILGMATYLESLSREERRYAQRVLKSEPEFVKAFQAAFDTESRKIHVPANRLNHFHTLWNRSVSSLSRQTCSTIIDEYVEKVDRVALRCGITPDIRRSLAVNWDEKLVEKLSMAAEEYAGSDFITGASSIQTGGDSYRPGSDSWERAERRRQIRRVGLTLLKVGGIITISSGLLCLVGLLTLGSGGGSDIGYVMIGAGWIGGTVGVVILLIALIMAIIAVSMPKTPEPLDETTYAKRIQVAVDEVQRRRTDYAGRLEYLVAEMSVKYKVDFNDIWKRLR